VLPSRIRPGERVSGRVVENPSDYENTPELMVTRFALPGNAGTLSGWQVEISGEPSQAADGPIALTVPPGQLGLAVLFRPTGTNAGAPVSRTIKIASAKGASQGKAAASYLAPPVCVKDEICIVRGAFNGNSSKTFAAFETRPAQIIAETSNALYLAIPEATEPGPRPLVIAEGAKAIAFPTVVAEFSIQPDRRSLHAGDQLLMYPTVEGPSDLPDPEWRTGNFPPSNLELARKLVPEFQPRGSAGAPEKHVAEERREKEKAGEKGEPEGSEAGEILLVVKNLTPDIATFRGSKDGIFVFHLNPAAFTMGDFKYKFVVEAKQTGNFAVQGWLIPFLAPVTGQEFPVTAAASK